MSHSPATSLDVGSVIAGTYTIEGLLGKGGMGAVFVASHARLPGKKVAIKVLHPDVADSEVLARFRREAEIASRLGHPNIVEVHDWNQLADGTPYLVLEFLQGEALSDRLRRGAMSLAEVAPIVRQVGSALAAAHREHIVHRDLKPQNIFLVPADDGVSVKAKVLDFGISKIRGSTTVKTQDTAMLGTPQYMAPEQATGKHDQVDGRTDVFALGAVVYEMLAGTPAFGGSTIPEVVFKVVYEETPPLAERVPGLPPHAVAAVHRALAKKLDERWPDVVSFVEALTGSPLATGRRGMIAAPGDGTPAAAPTRAQDAYAATVGSGDHGAAVAADVRASLGAAQTLAPGAEVPQALGAGTGVAGPPIAAGTGTGPRPDPMDAMGAVGAMGAMGAPGAGSAGAMAAGNAAGAVETAPPRPRRTGLLVAITAVAAAVVAVVVFLVVRQGTSSSAGTGSAVASGTAEADAGSPTEPVAVGNGSGSEAGSAAAGSGSGSAGGSADGSGSGSVVVGSGSSGGSDAVAGSGSGSGARAGSGSATGGGSGSSARGGGSGSGSSAHGGGSGSSARGGSGSSSGSSGGSARGSSGDGGGSDDEDDDTVRELLSDAQAAVAAGDGRGAMRLAKKVTTRRPKSQRGWAIRAQAACLLGDREAAKAALRRVSRRGLISEAKAGCSDAGLNL